MKRTKVIMLFSLLIFAVTGCNGQSKISSEKKYGTAQGKVVGGGCDGCELMYVGMPSDISSVDTSAGWAMEGRKLMITGKTLKQDGKTPAPDVILYYWHTDNTGMYTPKDGMDVRAKRHGFIRGWVKSDAEGNYTIYTIRPAAYPTRSGPEHIHIAIKEPDIKDEYYIDDLVFDDDPLLIPELKKRKPRNRGGNGVLRVLLSDDLQIAEHNIILGLNIPDYPETYTSEKLSGLHIGEDSPSFTPYHAWGPDKGTKVCPVCKYGRYHGVLYFVGNHPDWKEIKDWLSFLELESIRRKKYLKAYFVYGNENSFDKAETARKLEEVGKELNIRHLALTYVPSLRDSETEANLNQINPEVKNTFVIYKHRKIIDKYIDLKPTIENFKIVSGTLDKTRGEYFHLPDPYH